MRARKEAAILIDARIQRRLDFRLSAAAFASEFATIMKLENQLVRRALAQHQAGATKEAIENYRLAIDNNPNDTDALHLLGLLLHEEGDNGQAIDLISKAIAIRPDLVAMHNSLGVVQMAIGDLDVAASSFRTAIAKMPTLQDARNNLVRLALELKRQKRFQDSHCLLSQLSRESPDDLDLIEKLAELDCELDNASDAIERYQSILKANPNRRRTLLAMANVCERHQQVDRTVQTCVEILKQEPAAVAAHLMLGLVLSSRLAPQHRAKLDLDERDHLRERSLWHLQHAVKLEPSAETFDALGQALIRCGRHRDAIEILKQSIDLVPRFGSAHENLGRVWLEIGELESAQKHFEIAVEINPRSCEAQFELARLERSQSDTAIDSLQQILGRDDLSSHERMKLRFALARRLDAAEQHDDAFESYALANQEKTVSTRASRGRPIEELTERVINVFNQDYFGKCGSRVQEDAAASIEPVFIVGMPRSGTTLVEQILSSHSSVFGAGELHDISDIANSLSRRTGVSDVFPESVLAMDDPLTNSIRKEYLAKLSQMVHDAGHGIVKVTDKMPTNFKYLGLIARMFPNAKIVNLIRDPRDVCVSCFKQNLEWPFCDLVASADYYHEYSRLMSHWRRVLRLRIHDVHYENLVHDQERESRRLIDFVELPWDLACLDFATSDRAVQTPSKWQVRQPIYHSSIGAWKRYEKHLYELVARLG